MNSRINNRARHEAYATWLVVATLCSVAVVACQWSSKVETSIGFGSDSKTGDVAWWLRELPKRGATWDASGGGGERFSFQITDGKKFVQEFADDPAEAAKLAIAKWNQ